MKNKQLPNKDLNN